MIYNIVKNKKEFLELKESWQSLEETCKNTHYYNTFKLIYEWFDKVQQNTELRIICVLHNNEVVGIAPLCIENKKKYVFFNIRELSFLGWGDYKTFLYNDSVSNISSIFKTFFQAIESISDDWDKLVLRNLRQDSYLVYFLKKTLYHPYLRSYNEAPFITKNNYSRFDQYLSQYKDKRLETNERRLLKDDPFEYKLFLQPTQGQLEEVMNLHVREKDELNIKSDKVTRTSPFANSKRKAFHLALESVEHTLSLAALFRKSDNKIIAYELYYRFKGIIYCWNMGYDPQYANYGVLRILNKNVVKSFFDQDSDLVYDYGSGGYMWKYQNTNEFCLLYRLEKFSHFSKKAKLKNKLMSLRK